ncbi:FAD:protein FMN transferase [Brumicola pallidula]|jgi:thiamine biosynthesis lipoprotein|uniref:FAD:protein FMN transferase n=1 Tax=Brumicola pallidula DSM 14239 = ACAM 615 TaxID=1121922 RepID=K6Z1U9_9ALTE|nr:FAD:protein FMN transferase [Glaciecola pallidula]GAC30191.1 thiamine biosynthesis lipoprotein [Glaciecola pallidula DSM 14239 = ACAM 615]
MNIRVINSVLLVLVLAFSASLKAEWYSESAGIMGTNIYVEVWAETPVQGELALRSVMAEMERINQLMSPYIDTSELSLINAKAGQQPVVISDEMFELLDKSVNISALTKGAFDITFASVGYLYNYKQNQRPDEATIASLLAAVNYKHIDLNKHNKTVAFTHEKVKIDLGGIAKGHAVDNSISLLERMGIMHGLVTAGGDTRLIGDRRGKPWIVGIRDPRDEEKQAVVMPLQDSAMSTSGDYERYFEEDGKRYHHILSPKTGKSTYDVQSVSIIGPSSTYNDALSTAVFVMGLRDGLGMINRIDGYDAVVMDYQRKMHYSNGLQQ